MTGLELRGCWQARLVAGEGQPNSVTSVGARAAAAHVDPDALPTRDFVPVELVGPLRLRTLPVVSANQAGTEPGPEPAAVPLPIVTGDADPGWTERTSLFGDLDS